MGSCSGFRRRWYKHKWGTYFSIWLVAILLSFVRRFHRHYVWFTSHLWLPDTGVIALRCSLQVDTGETKSCRSYNPRTVYSRATAIFWCICLVSIPHVVAPTITFFDEFRVFNIRSHALYTIRNLLYRQNWKSGLRRKRHQVYTCLKKVKSLLFQTNAWVLSIVNRRLFIFYYHFNRNMARTNFDFPLQTTFNADSGTHFMVIP